MKLKVRLDFSDFWPGYVKTNNFFHHLLAERFEVEICDQPDFLIYSDPFQHGHRLHKCVKIYYSTESFLPDFNECDYAFTCHELGDPRQMRLPNYALYPVHRIDKKKDDLAEIMRAKTKFCGFLAGYANKKTAFRTNFFHKLCKYKKVDSAGSALNNTGFRVPPGPAPKIEFLKPYKFNLAFENASIPHYTTEKIYEAMMARSMPIYWGNPGIAGEFNTKSFLNYFDFVSEDALIEKIVELDKDDGKYMEYLRQPYFNNDQPNEFFSRERLLDQFEKIFTTKITPVSHQRPWFQLGRWIAVKQYKPH